MIDIPSSVYRIQVSQDFRLTQVIEIIPYLLELGLEGIYTSPLFEAYASGYDIINPNQLNHNLGSHEDFEKLCSDLGKYQMKWLIDVVPNHMGTKGNPWWLSVLEYGETSPYADFFDINWKANAQVVLPILNDPFEEAIKKEEIKLVWNHGFWIHYFDYVLPVNYSSYYLIFSNQEKTWQEYVELIQSEKKESFITLLEKQDFAQTSRSLMEFVNQSPELLHELLKKQKYRLAFWKDAGDEINYRRFFNINDLVAIHTENEKVFTAYHQWVFQLLESGKVHGLRIDHPDGLYDPALYFQHLREKRVPFVWAEKILDHGETLPPYWEIEGSVGYDFLNVLSGSFVQKKNEQKMTEVYQKFTEQQFSIQEILYERRKWYIDWHMTSELNFLAYQLEDFSREFTKVEIMQACKEIMACFPVYRTYIRPHAPIHKNDRKYILHAVEMAKQRSEEKDPTIFDYLKGILLLEYTGSEKEQAIKFVLHFQQLTPTVMAKGLEDSTFYIYNRLISLNEVGGYPETFGNTKKEFHTFNQKKLKKWPLGALSTSTHDTKFSEDARMLLHVLSEIPDKWNRQVSEWKRENQIYKVLNDGKLIPDLNTEYYLYQMLLAIWPADEARIWSCVNKALREAGLYTSWQQIDETYESAIHTFLTSILSPQTPFYHSFITFHKHIAQYGIFNSLSALVLKVGSCGIIDLYQGNETLQFYLMDPDNRRPLNVKKLKTKNGDLKKAITQKALHFRKEHKVLFLHGDYIPLKTPERVIGFVRKNNNQEVIVLAQRFFTEQETIDSEFIPINVHSKTFKDIFTDQEIAVHKEELRLADVFKKHPFALLTNV